MLGSTVGIRMACLCCVVVGGVLNGVLLASDEKKDALLREYIEGSRELRQFYGNLKGEATYTEKRGKLRRDSKFRFMSSDGRLRLDHEIVGSFRPGGEGDRESYVATVDRAFWVTQDKGVPSHILRNLVEGERARKTVHRIRADGAVFSSPLGMFADPLEQWLSQPTIRVDDVVRSGAGAAQRVILQLSFLKGCEHGEGKCTLELMSGRKWAVDRCEWSTNPRSRHEWVNEYLGEYGGVPVIHSLHGGVWLLKGSDKTLSDSFDWTVTRLTPAPEPVSDSEFSLTAFGLPEVAKRTPAGFGNIWWIGAVLFGALVPISLWASRRVATSKS